MTTEIKYCPNPDECDGKCLPLQDVIEDVDEKLNNVMNFIISFFEDDENIQPIKKELQSVINSYQQLERHHLRGQAFFRNLKDREK